MTILSGIPRTKESRTVDKKAKRWKYHTSHKCVYMDKGKEYPISFVTQLYQVGVYGIVNGDAGSQGGYTPNQLVTMERRLKKQQEAGIIKDLEFGREIIVTTDEDGFFVEVDE